ncbi:MAG: hypothetical protein ABIR54_00185 [Burkholderiaceae bacterium]
MAQKLYAQVLSRHPIGAIKGTDMTVFAPFLSKALRHRMDLTADCEADFFRKNPRTDLKPTFGWLELGPFSGGDERAAPSAFRVGKARPVAKGVARVYVTLTYAETNEPDWSWQVAVDVGREEGRYVVRDVLYLKDKDVSSDYKLSRVLSAGCDGPRWVGAGQQ